MPTCAILFVGECFCEDLLGLMDGQTTSEILFTRIAGFFEEHNLDLARIKLLVTDGAPSMVGRDHGKVAAAAPQMRPPLCFIHQSPVCQMYWRVKKDHGVCHSNYTFYLLHLRTKSCSFTTTFDGLAKETR